MGLGIPLKYKLFFPAALGVAATGLLFSEITLKGLEEDRTLFGLEIARSVGESARMELEAALKLRLREAQSLAQQAPVEQGNKLFDQATSDFRDEVISISVYEPQENATYKIRSTTNRKLLQARQLPENTPWLIDQAKPLDMRSIARQRQALVLNRTFSHGDQITPVQTHVLFMKGLDANPKAKVVVLDLLGEALAGRLQRSEQVHLFLVDTSGRLVAHPDAATALKYQARDYPGFPVDQLPRGWEKGARFSWEYQAKNWLTWITPTAIDGVFLTAQVDKKDMLAVFAPLTREFWKGSWALLAILGVLSLWMGSRVERNIRNTAAALKCMSEGNFKAVPRIHGRDAFRHISQGFALFETRLKERLRDEFDKGQEDAKLATTQALRAMMGNPDLSSMQNWECSTYRSSKTTAFQDFWDFHQNGNRRQIIVGRSSTEGPPGILLTLVARTTLECIRRLTTKDSSHRMVSLVDTLSGLNAVLHTVFKGRATLIATAIEIDIDSGSMQWVQAGGTAPIQWQRNDRITSASPGAAQEALGAKPTALYKSVSAPLAPGEAVLIHTDTPKSKNAVSDVFESIISESLNSHGSKTLGEFKASLLEKSHGRPGLESLAFVLFKRPSAQRQAGASKQDLPKAA